MTESLWFDSEGSGGPFDFFGPLLTAPPVLSLDGPTCRRLSWLLLLDGKPGRILLEVKAEARRVCAVSMTAKFHA